MSFMEPVPCFGFKKESPVEILFYNTYVLLLLLYTLTILLSSNQNIPFVVFVFMKTVP